MFQKSNETFKLCCGITLSWCFLDIFSRMAQRRIKKEKKSNYYELWLKDQEIKKLNKKLKETQKMKEHWKSMVNANHAEISQAYSDLMKRSQGQKKWIGQVTESNTRSSRKNQTVESEYHVLQGRIKTYKSNLHQMQVSLDQQSRQCHQMTQQIQLLTSHTSNLTSNNKNNKENNNDIENKNENETDDNKQCEKEKEKEEDVEMRISGGIRSNCVVCGVIGGFRCSKCKSVRYCGKKCQYQHWKTHRPQCKNRGN